ncbi:carbonic anhydrase, partial [Streptococcus pneumoniae]
MSYFEQFMQANQAYVALHGQLNLPLKPKTRVAIVTCMDSRLHVAQALGLALGDAHI